MSHKLVSIIIPTFNRASLVGEAIRSAQSQSYPAKQIIVVDDGSQDDTAELLNQFQGIECYRQENKGQGSARNLGLLHAKGEYVATLDSDDIWYPNFLSTGINCVEKYNLDFAFLNWTTTTGIESYIDIWERGRKWQQFIEKKDDIWYLLDPKKMRRLLLESCLAPSSSLLLRRSSIVSQWNEEMIAADDWFLLLDMALSKSLRIAFTLSPHWLKRVHGDNVYDGRNKLEIISNAIQDEQALRTYFSSHLTPAEKRIINKRLALYHVYLGQLAWKNNDISKNMLVNIATGFGLAPLGVCFQSIKVFRDRIKNLKSRLLSNP